MFRIAAVWFQFTDGGGLPDIPIHDGLHVVGREDSNFARTSDHRTGGAGQGK